MADEVVRGILQNHDLQVVVAIATDATRHARQAHALHSAAASLLGQAIAGATMMASLQKSATKVNLQLECDGPLRGLFVDASSNGDVRGYVKNPIVDVELGAGQFRWRAALGNSGFLSVLRDVGTGEFYRSSIELKAMSIPEDLTAYFAASEQVSTHVALSQRRLPEEHLGLVAGVLVQSMPQGDPTMFLTLAERLQKSLDAAMEKHDLVTTDQLVAALQLPSWQLTSRSSVQWKCTCSKQRVLDTLASLGLAEVQDILDTQGSTAVTCQFCATKHEVSFHDLVALVNELSKNIPKN